MRNYSGILDNSVFINEKKLASFCGTTTEQLTNGLFRLESLGIIEYLQKKNTPQILFLSNRASASELQINTVNYFDRKKRFENRLLSIEDYLINKEICRSVIIAKYFNAPTEICGICDNCLQSKKTPVNADDFTTIQKSLMLQIPVSYTHLTLPTIYSV